MLIAAGILIGLVVGSVVGVLVVRSAAASRFDKAMRARQQLLHDAEREAEALRREAHVEAREDANEAAVHGIEEPCVHSTIR